MTNRTTVIGTMLLIGALFLTLNALAVSARPGDGTQAEKTTSIAVAILPGATASETVTPTGGRVAVPVPPPTLNPTLIGSSRDVAMQPAMLPIDGPTTAPGPGVTPPSASVRETQGVTTGPGMYPNNPGQTGPVLPGNGIINPGLTPVPIPPLNPGMAKVTPVPVPPGSVDPVRNSI